MPARTGTPVTGSSVSHSAGLAQEYRPIGIGAVAAALCVTGKRESPPVRRETEEALLRRFDLAA